MCHNQTFPTFDAPSIATLAIAPEPGTSTNSRWQKLNVTAFLMSGIVGAHPDIVGETYRVSVQA